MERIIALVGNLSGIAGILLCLVSGATRFLGDFHLFDFTAITIFQAGTGLMVLGCLAKLELLLMRAR
jgi:hypothetical protein